jgi:hypothetical protein
MAACHVYCIKLSRDDTCFMADHFIVGWISAKTFRPEASNSRVSYCELELFQKHTQKILLRL